jgi:predicted Zn-dependent peptidase
MRVETQPSAELGEAVDAALYVNHPYGDPVIGWPNEIAGLTFEDALSFYRDFYHPGNAVLVIAGDVSVDDIRALAAETYGAIPGGEQPITRDRPEAQRLDSDRTSELRDPRVNQPSTQVNWLVPSYIPPRRARRRPSTCWPKSSAAPTPAGSTPRWCATTGSPPPPVPGTSRAPSMTRVS